MENGRERERASVPISSQTWWICSLAISILARVLPHITFWQGVNRYQSTTLPFPAPCTTSRTHQLFVNRGYGNQSWPLENTKKLSRIARKCKLNILHRVTWWCPRSTFGEYLYYVKKKISHFLNKCMWIWRIFSFSGGYRTILMTNSDSAWNSISDIVKIYSESSTSFSTKPLHHSIYILHHSISSETQSNFQHLSSPFQGFPGNPHDIGYCNILLLVSKVSLLHQRWGRWKSETTLKSSRCFINDMINSMFDISSRDRIKLFTSRQICKHSMIVCMLSVQ